MRLWPRISQLLAPLPFSFSLAIFPVVEQDPMEYAHRFGHMGKESQDEDQRYTKILKVSFDKLAPSQSFKLSAPRKKFLIDPRQRVEWSLRLGQQQYKLDLVDLYALNDHFLLDAGLWQWFRSRVPNLFDASVNWTEIAKDINVVLKRFSISQRKGLMVERHGPWWQWFEAAMPPQNADKSNDPALKALGVWRETKREKIINWEAIEEVWKSLGVNRPSEHQSFEIALVKYIAAPSSFRISNINALLASKVVSKDYALNLLRAAIGLVGADETFKNKCRVLLAHDHARNKRNDQLMELLHGVEAAIKVEQLQDSLKILDYLYQQKLHEEDQVRLTQLSGKVLLSLAYKNLKQRRYYASWAAEYIRKGSRRGLNSVYRDEMLINYARALSWSELPGSAYKYYRIVYQVGGQKKMRLEALRQSIEEQVKWAARQKDSGFQSKQFRESLFFLGQYINLSSPSEAESLYKKSRKIIKQSGLMKNAEVVAALNEVAAKLDGRR